MKSRAFTLIEAIVVIIVLAVLAAFSFPVFAWRTEIARRSSCQENLKRISLGIKQYQSDFDERYPLVCITSGSSHGMPPYGWADALLPYTKSTRIFQCPTDTSKANDVPTSPGYTDYWYNANFVIKIPRGSTFHLTTVCEIGSISQTVIVGEGGNTNGSPGHDARYNQCGDGTVLTGPTQTCPVSPIRPATLLTTSIHLGGANYAFADGHVAWIKSGSPKRDESIFNNGLGGRDMEGVYTHVKTFSMLRP
jgi:prepilin-type processing-associated H-X9-DG protein/prepilin-type N-terminal cleavage/methylation domain-containing protein